MKDEIKEILKKFKKINEEYSLDTELDFEDYEIPNIYLKQFLDYITNLQKYYNDNVNKYEELLVKYSNLQKENENLKDYLKIMEKGKDNNLNRFLDYKSRCEKAIPMLKKLNIKIKEILKTGIDIKEISDIKNLLNGGDDNE